MSVENQSESLSPGAEFALLMGELSESLLTGESAVSIGTRTIISRAGTAELNEDEAPGLKSLIMIGHVDGPDGAYYFINVLTPDGGVRQEGLPENLNVDTLTDKDATNFADLRHVVKRTEFDAAVTNTLGEVHGSANSEPTVPNE